MSTTEIGEDCTYIVPHFLPLFLPLPFPLLLSYPLSFTLLLLLNPGIEIGNEHFIFSVSL